MDFFARQDASRRATRYLVFLFALAFLAVGLVTGMVLLVAFGFIGNATQLPAGAGFRTLIASNIAPLGAAIAGVVGAMTLASLFRGATISRGGGQVARMLGGTRIQSDDPDLLHRRLLNVVEEMSIASGLPMPEVYLLEQERGINAFAAGLTPADAAVAVTQGALERLDRAELSGVIAHEFSHISNGDMRLNLRLMAFSFGILVLWLVGRWVLRASSHGARLGSGRRRGGAGIMIGLAVLVVGGIGVLLSRLIKAAVSRQRETLADASAVQFTREPQALAGALKKIAGFTPHLESVGAEEVSHMLFGRAGRSFAGLFATHPPIAERIRALDPTYAPGDERVPASAAPAEMGAVGAAGTAEIAGAVGAAGAAEIAGALGAAGAAESAAVAGAGAANLSPPPIDLTAAGTIQPATGSRLHAAIPADLLDAVHGRESAYLLVLALGLETSGPSADQERLLLSHLGAQRATRCRQLREAVDGIDARLRLPLFELAVPALKNRPSEQIEYLFDLLEKLAASDERLTLHEYLLGRLLRTYFTELGEMPADPGRDQRASIAILIATLAVEGSEDPELGRAAFGAGIDAAENAGMRTTARAAGRDDDAETALRRARAQRHYAELDRALATLAAAPLKTRRACLEGLAAALRHDRQATVAEAEIFRTVAAVLGCPIPPGDRIG